MTSHRVRSAGVLMRGAASVWVFVSCAIVCGRSMYVVKGSDGVWCPDDGLAVLYHHHLPRRGLAVARKIYWVVRRDDQEFKTK